MMNCMKSVGFWHSIELGKNMFGSFIGVGLELVGELIEVTYLLGYIS